MPFINGKYYSPHDDFSLTRKELKLFDPKLNLAIETGKAKDLSDLMDQYPYDQRQAIAQIANEVHPQGLDFSEPKDIGESIKEWGKSIVSPFTEAEPPPPDLTGTILHSLKPIGRALDPPTRFLFNYLPQKVRSIEAGQDIGKAEGLYKDIQEHPEMPGEELYQKTQDIKNLTREAAKIPNPSFSDIFTQSAEDKPLDVLKSFGAEEYAKEHPYQSAGVDIAANILTPTVPIGKMSKGIYDRFKFAKEASEYEKEAKAIQEMKDLSSSIESARPADISDGVFEHPLQDRVDLEHSIDNKIIQTDAPLVDLKKQAINTGEPQLPDWAHLPETTEGVKQLPPATRETLERSIGEPRAFGLEGVIDDAERPSISKPFDDELDYKPVLTPKEAEQSLRNYTFNFPKDYSMPNLETAKTAALVQKDLPRIKGFKQPEMVFDEVFGENAPEAAETFFKPLNENKALGSEYGKFWLDRLDKDVFSKFKFKPGDVFDQYIQKYGEGKITFQKLISKVGRKKADQIVEADKWFRDAYDTLIDDYNTHIAKVYENNPKQAAKLHIEKRNDYYRHFNDESKFGWVKELFGGSTELIDEGYKEGKLTSRIQSIMKKRTGKETGYGAIKGFLNYIPQISYAKYINPNINALQALATDPDLVKKAPVFSQYLTRIANRMSGIPSKFDQALMEHKNIFNVAKWIQHRTQSNIAGANVSMAASQFLNLPHGLADAGLHSVPAAVDTFRQIIGLDKDAPAAKSAFLRNRGGSVMFERFNTKLWQQPSKAIKHISNIIDHVSTRWIWNANYRKAVASGVKDPITEASRLTKMAVGGRGAGEMALAYNSLVTRMLAPFTYEAVNSLYMLKKMVGDKRLGAAVGAMALSYIANQGKKELTGFGGAFDPIQAGIDSIDSWDWSHPMTENIAKTVGRFGGEVMAQLPFGSLASQMYPEKGGAGLPTRNELFGTHDPGRFGMVPFVPKSLEDVIALYGFPSAGKQFFKTKKGLEALSSGSYKTKSGKEIPLDIDIADMIKLPLFGPSSMPEVQDYYEKLSKDMSDRDRMKRLKYEHISR